MCLCVCHKDGVMWVKNCLQPRSTLGEAGSLPATPASPGLESRPSRSEPRSQPLCSDLAMAHSSHAFPSECPWNAVVWAGCPCPMTLNDPASLYWGCLSAPEYNVKGADGKRASQAGDRKCSLTPQPRKVSPPRVCLSHS